MRNSIFLFFILSLPLSGIVAQENEEFFNRIWIYPDRIDIQESQYIDEVLRPGSINKIRFPRYVESLYDDFEFHELLLNYGIIYLIDDRSEIRKATVKNLFWHENGYASLQIGGIDLDIIFGSFLFAVPSLPSWQEIKLFGEQVKYSYEWSIRFWNGLQHQDKHISMTIVDRGGYLYEPIKQMKVPSVLSETIGGQKVTYGTDFLRYRWLYSQHRTAELQFVDGVPPWVEAEPGDGTGVKFELEFKEAVDNVVFLKRVRGYAEKASLQRKLSHEGYPHYRRGVLKGFSPCRSSAVPRVSFSPRRC